MRAKVRPSQYSGAQIEFTLLMTQLPVNLNDATTGHKLQGMSLDSLIILSFLNKILRALFKNWEYVVLLRMQTLSGFSIFNKIDEDKSLIKFKQAKILRTPNF